ncbi:hypothetical protein [Actinomadura kijaniata]|uniref:hypothetical protein n=1 Tax=Actinomadura kijaniata TaxID=46161 RepID=UPI000836AEC5|nr:hypothetical protein [Actinomadura kijaniata]
MRHLLVAALMAGGAAATIVGFVPSVTDAAVPATRVVRSTTVDLRIERPTGEPARVRPGRAVHQVARQVNTDRR